MPSDPSTVHVRLLVSDEDCTECQPGIGPKRGSGTADPMADVRPGAVHVIGEDLASPADDTVDVDAATGVARFRLLPNAAPTDLTAQMVAIGIDAGGHPTEMARLSLAVIPDGRYEQLELGPIPGAITIWSASTTYSCVEIEPPDAKDREFFVPPSDVDCDGILNEKDCRPLDFSFGDVTTPDEASCAATANQNGNDACFIGNINACPADGSTPSDKCSPLDGTPTCAPDSFCTGACSTSLSPADCVLNSSSNFDCVIKISTVDGEVCDTKNVVIDPQCKDLGVETFGAGRLTLEGFGTMAELLDDNGQPFAEVDVTDENLGGLCGDRTFFFPDATPALVNLHGSAWAVVHFGGADEVVPLHVQFKSAGDNTKCSDIVDPAQGSTCAFLTGSSAGVVQCP